MNDRLLAFLSLALVAVLLSAFVGGARAATLTQADLQQAFDCLTRKEQLFGLADEFVSRGAVTYTMDQAEAGERGNVRVNILVYAPSRAAAVLFELQINTSARCHTVIVLSFASIDRRGGKWVVTETEGGTPEYEEAQRILDRLAKARRLRMRLGVSRTCATCKVN